MRLFIIGIIFCFLGCNEIYEAPPFFIGEDKFTLEHAKQEAPYIYKYGDTNKYNLYNIPLNIKRDSKGWGIIKNKYASTELIYGVYEINGVLHLKRQFTRINNPIINDPTEISYFKNMLKESGIKEEDCKILMNIEDKEFKSRHIRFIYKGVKHYVIISRGQTTIKSCLDHDVTFWVEQGYLPSTPK